MKTKLTEAEKADLLPDIRTVLRTGEPMKRDDLHHPAGAIIDAILEIDGVTKEPTEDSDEGFDTNGWQFDWWQSFKHGGKTYILSGSGYYGGHQFLVEDDG
jgi:hypothetical protein